MKRNSLCCSRSARTAASCSSPTADSASIAVSRSILRRARWRGSDEQRFDEGALAVDRAADHDVLQHRGLADDARGLERARDAHVRARVWRASAGSAAPFSCTLAALRRVVAGDHVQRRGLAAAVRADQSMHLRRAGSSRSRPSMARTPPKLSATCSSVSAPGIGVLRRAGARADRAAGRSRGCSRAGGGS